MKTSANEKEVVTENGSGRSSWIAISNVHNPTITPYLPAADKATGIAVVVAPGGGHRLLAISHEGYDVGQWLADHGIAAFVLKYRLERGTTGANYTVAKEALADVERAIRTVRSRAAEWHINPDAIGVMGFSAGGQMAALAAKEYDDGDSAASDPVERVSSRPAFQALIYPGRSYLIVPDKNSPPAFLACSLRRPARHRGRSGRSLSPFPRRGRPGRAPHLQLRWTRLWPPSCR